MKTRKATAELKKINNINELDPKILAMIHSSERAVATAYAPNSGFSVGAAVLMADGHIVPGSNQENMAYPSGLCAERVAIFSASAQYPSHLIKAVAICCDPSVGEHKDVIFSPCGACRQVLFEYEWKQHQPIQLYMKVRYQEDVWLAENIEMLMPFPFILPEKPLV